MLIDFLFLVFFAVVLVAHACALFFDRPTVPLWRQYLDMPTPNPDAPFEDFPRLRQCCADLPDATRVRSLINKYWSGSIDTATFVTRFESGEWPVEPEVDAPARWPFVSYDERGFPLPPVEPVARGRPLAAASSERKRAYLQSLILHGDERPPGQRHLLPEPYPGIFHND